jgi:hypothetical protein
MATSAKVGGNWKSLSGVSVNISDTWRTVNSAYVKVAGQWKQWFAAFITDNFNRSTSGTLGTSSSGATCTTLRSNWYANGGQAQSDSSSSDYPLAVVGWGPKTSTVSASVVSGTGLAFWVSDAGSWWGAVSYNSSTPYSYGINPYSCNCQTCGTYQCNSCPNPVCDPLPIVYTCNPGDNYVGGGECRNSDGAPYYASVSGGGYGTCENCYYCGGVNNTYQCNCQTCYTGYATGYTYNYYLRLLNSVSGTVSTATGDISLGEQAAAIVVNTVGDTITAKAYSNTSLTNQIGTTLTYTPTSPTKGSFVGILKAPSNYNQGSTVDNFSVGL